MAAIEKCKADFKENGLLLGENRLRQEMVVSKDHDEGPKWDG